MTPERLQERIENGVRERSVDAGVIVTWMQIGGGSAIAVIIHCTPGEAPALHLFVLRAILNHFPHVHRSIVITTL